MSKDAKYSIKAIESLIFTRFASILNNYNHFSPPPITFHFSEPLQAQKNGVFLAGNAKIKSSAGCK
jgi:hypothetical protein